MFRIARALERHCAGPSLELTVAAAEDGLEPVRGLARDADRVMAMDWRCAEKLDLQRDRVLTAVHSHKSWDGGDTTPEHRPPPPADLIARLGEYLAVQFVSRELHRLFAGAGLRNGVYVPNGVETAEFPRAARAAGSGTARLIVGSASKIGLDELKGVSAIIAPAAQDAGAEMRWAAGDTAPAAMPAFYASLDAYVCASSSEGMSMAVLEAAATGRPIISTRVGDLPELVRHERTGLLVDRDRRAVAQAIRRLDRDREWCAALGRSAADEVVRRWAWPRRAEAWREFLLHAREARQRQATPTLAQKEAA